MTNYLYFGNLQEFWNYSFQESHARIKASRNGRQGMSWDKNLTWEEAKHLAQSGWLEGMNEIEKYRALLEPQITKHILRPVPESSYTGYAVDVGAYMSNNPECFITKGWEKKNYPGKLFTIVVSCSFSCNVDADTIIKRGTLVCALVDALEYAGHRVEVICNDTSTKYGCKNEIDVVVKNHEQPLDMTDLAFCLAHPAMLRRIIFSANELMGWSDYTSGSYGSPSEATNQGDLYINEIHSGKIVVDEAVTWLLDKLRALGIDFAEDLEER